MFHSNISYVTTNVSSHPTARETTNLLRQAAMALGLSASLVGHVGFAGTAKAADHYAAIWEKNSGPTWVARHGLTSAAYQQEFDKLIAQGYRLKMVNGYPSGGQDLYAAIWEKRPGPAWVARHGLSADAYQQEFDKLVGQGYRLKRVSGYMVEDKDHYAAIWEKSYGPVWVARHGLTPAAYQQEFNKLIGQGYRLTHISGYGTMTQTYFAAIWEKSDGPGWIARHGLNAATYQKAFDEYTSKGFRLKQVSVYQFLGRDRYAAIWEKSAGTPWVARHGLTSDGYQREFDKLVGQGYRLTDVSSN
jgi:hypothetical protein